MFPIKLVEKIETHILCCVCVCEIMWKNVVGRDRPQMTIWRMRIACWIPKATNTHIGCVIQHLHYNSGCTNAPHCCVVPALLVLCCNCYENVNVMVTVS